MDQVKQRMQLTTAQRSAVIHLDDNGVADPVSLFVMDFETWQMLRPVNFFNFFTEDGTVSSFARFKPVWQRYTLLQPIEAKVLQGIYDELKGDTRKILNSKKLSRRYYDAYVIMSDLVDELDVFVDKELRIRGQWNHGYILNDKILVD